MDENNLNSRSSIRTRMDYTQGLGGLQLLRLTSSKNVERWSNLLSNCLWKPLNQKTGSIGPNRLSNFEVKKTYEKYNPRDCKLRGDITTRFKVEMTEQKLQKFSLVIFWIVFQKDVWNPKRGRKKVNKGEE